MAGNLPSEAANAEVNLGRRPVLRLGQEDPENSHSRQSQEMNHSLLIGRISNVFALSHAAALKPIPDLCEEAISTLTKILQVQ